MSTLEQLLMEEKDGEILPKGSRLREIFLIIIAILAPVAYGTFLVHSAKTERELVHNMCLVDSIAIEHRNLMSRKIDTLMHRDTAFAINQARLYALLEFLLQNQDIEIQENEEM